MTSDTTDPTTQLHNFHQSHYLEPEQSLYQPDHHNHHHDHDHDHLNHPYMDPHIEDLTTSSIYQMDINSGDLMGSISSGDSLASQLLSFQ